jgi:hypothetical protein
MSQAGSLNNGGGGGGGSNVQTLTGNTGGAVPPTANNINVVGSGSITVTGNPGTSTLTISSSGGSGITTVDADTGPAITPTILTINTLNSSQHCGSSVRFRTNSSTFCTLDVTDSNNNTIFGASSGNASITGSQNCGFGDAVLSALSSGTRNVGIGVSALSSVTTSGNNIAIGLASLSQVDNSFNTAVGSLSLDSLTSGQYNIALGYNSGSSYSTSESSNILIGNTGTVTESNVIRIGKQGSSAGQQDACYVAGITGTTPTSANTPQVTLCDNAGNLTVISSGTSGFVLTSNGTATPSFQAASGSSGITTINGDSGSVTGSTVTIEAGISTQHCGSSVSFSGSGTTMTMNVTDSNFNTIVGQSSGTAVGIQNTVVGRGSCIALTSSGANNCVFGFDSGQGLTSGSSNCLFGDVVANSLTTGIQNVIIGHNAGGNYTSSESTNILLYHTGTTGESGAIHIGISPVHSSCYIAGIAGVTVSSSAAVLIDTATGQLGTISSSARFKDDIKSIEATDGLLQLNPVSFTYKAEKEKITHYGLIAEEVEKVFPELVVHGSDGLPESVKYHEMPALLLAEIKKLRNEINELKGYRS